jgi:GT2 family glycosyltransferase/NifU-like protein involved in Fe-S cluster formation
MRTSIVIASLNEGERLWKTVQSCLETTAELDCELVVADDASTDGSIDELRRRFPQVRVFAHAERRGVSLTKDLGARSSSGDVLVFLDGHCKPEPGAIARLVADVEELSGEAIVTPRIAALDAERWENKLYQVGHGYRMDLEKFDCGFIGLERMGVYARSQSRRFYESPAFIGCCAAMSRQLYERLWGFDPGMRSWGLEDLDFGLKAWLMGCPVLHDPEPLIGHRFRASFDNFPVPMEHIVLNQLRTARKIFSDTVWEDWVERCRARQPDWLWESAWQLFSQERDAVERERTYLLAHRVRDEFWYADYFGLSWPTPPAGVRFRQFVPAAGLVAVSEASSCRTACEPAPLAAAAARALEPADDPHELYLEHYRTPCNRRMLLPADAVGSATGPGGAVIIIYLRLGRGPSGATHIQEVTFQSQRCGVAVAYASLLTELVRGWSVQRANAFRPTELMRHFGAKAGATDSALLAITALERALERAGHQVPAAAS